MKRKITVIALGLFVLAASIGLLIIVHLAHPAKELSQAEFDRMLQANLIANAEWICSPKFSPLHEVQGAFYQTDAAGQILLKDGKPIELPFKTVVYLGEERLLAKLSTIHNFRVLERRW
jgi:hypothetical protein